MVFVKLFILFSYTNQVKECSCTRLTAKCGPESFAVYNELMKPFIRLANKMCESN